MTDCTLPDGLAIEVAFTGGACDRPDGLAIEVTLGADVYTVRVRARHVARAGYLATVRTRHRAPSAGRGGVSARHAGESALRRSLLASRHAGESALRGVVRARHLAPSAGRGGVSARHAAVSRILAARVGARHGAPFAVRQPANGRSAAWWRVLAAPARARHLAAYSPLGLTGGRHASASGSLVLTSGRHASASGSLALTLGRHTSVSGSLALTSGRHTSVSGSLALTSGRHAAVCGSLRVSLGRHAGTARLVAAASARHAGVSALLAASPARARHRASASAPDHQVDLLQVGAELWVAGRRLSLTGSVELTADQGSSLWSATFALDQAEDYARLRPGQAMTLRLGALEVALLCDSLSFARGDPPSYRVQALSPLALLGSPWSVPVQVGEGGLARAVCERLLGQPIDWRLPDWVLPTSVAAMEGTPLELVRQICAAPGGLLESRLDGSLVARASSPVSVPDYPSASVARLTDRHLFAHSASVDAPEIANRYTITSGESGAESGIQVETERDPDDAGAYTVRAYPVPWRSLSLVHTGDSATQIEPRAEVFTDHEELIEIAAGAGRLAYPLARLRGHRWQYTDLGAIRQPDPSSIAVGDASAYSLLAIQYQARAWQWRVTNARTETIQFLVVE